MLAVEYRNAGQFLVSYCTNLSRGGLFVSTPDPEPVGSELTLTLQVPGRDAPVSLRARVRWTRLRDNEEGSAGMGLSFADIDAVLGAHIDHLVQRASPLRIDLIGRSDHASAHLHALIRSLVNCETRQLALTAGADNAVGTPDLVIIDVDGNPPVALELLARLDARPSPPPRLALCRATDPDLRARARRHARVVPTPADKRELQLEVLEILGQVHGVKRPG